MKKGFDDCVRRIFKLRNARRNMKRDGFHLKYHVKRRVLVTVSVIVMAFLYVFRDTSYLSRSVSVVGLFFVFYLVDHLFNFHFKVSHYLFIFFIGATGFLLSPLYFVSPNYDKVLHLIHPIMFASIFYHMVTRLKLEKKWRLIVVFALVVAGIGLFEIWEHNLDNFFDLKLQGVYVRDSAGENRLSILQTGLDDTMVDMSLGVLGAAIYIIYADILWKKGRRKRLKAGK